MTRRIALALLLLTLGIALAGCGGDDDDDEGAGDATTEASSGAETEEESGGTTLTASVGPGFTISLDGTEGLTAGEYTIAVDDRSAAHNFHLTGPGGVDVATDVGETGEESLEVTLQAGEYRFVCDPHESSMNGTFTVG
ncbi:MAG: cupredoxin domain-containing protein [Gaiellaceae bacterium]